VKAAPTTGATSTPVAARAAERRRKPVYIAIQDYILDLVNGPDYGPGDKVPSERALADQLGANRMTVRKAIDRLVDRGVLERNGTSGTRIPLPRVARPIDVRESLGITRIIRNAGGTPGNRLLHFGEQAAPDSVAARLQIAPGSATLLIRRLWTVSETPFCIETTYLPADRFPDLHAEDLMAGQSLYGLLDQRYGVHAAVADREISVGSCTQLEARLLALEAGSAALVLRVVAHDERGRPVEYTKSVNNPHLVVFRTAASGPEGVP
jgi:GntR family transcriptional regulator